jgi:hypothetical protein
MTIPLLPEVVIWMVGAFAGLMGCQNDQNLACLTGSPAVVINFALWAAGVEIVKSTTWRTYFYLATGGWLVICYLALMMGWARAISRILLGSVVALFFALQPFCAPLLAIKTFADDRLCKPESSGCELFGGQVEKAYAALEMAKLPLNDWAPLMIAGIFFGFVVVVVASGPVSARRPGKS